MHVPVGDVNTVNAVNMKASLRRKDDFIGAPVC